MSTNLQVLIKFDLSIHIGVDFAKDLVQFLTRNVRFTEALLSAYRITQYVAIYHIWCVV